MQPNANAVLCQSIHQETNGKFILVGVVAGILQTDSSDFQDEFCLFLNINDVPAGEHTIHLRLRSPENKGSTAAMTLKVPTQALGATVQVNGIPFETKKSGLFRLDWKIGDARKWNKLIDVPVELSAEILEGDLAKDATPLPAPE